MESPPYLCLLFVATAGQQGVALGADEEEIVLLVYVVLDVVLNKVVGVNQYLVKPRVADINENVLSEQLVTQTALTEDLVKSGQPLEAAVQQFDQYARASFHPRGLRLVTDGQLPLRQCLHPEACSKGLDLPHYYNLFHDLRKEFRAFYAATEDIASIQDMDPGQGNVAGLGGYVEPADGPHLAVSAGQVLHVAHRVGETHVLEGVHVVHHPVVLDDLLLGVAGHVRLLLHVRQGELEKVTMSSGFISEAELAERRRTRQEEWQKVRKPDQPEEAPEEEYDHRSLFERLEEQKHKKDMEYEEAHKLKNMIKGLDDDEVEFLDLVDRTKLEQERLKTLEEAREIRDFRDAVATLQERSLEDRINTEIRARPHQPHGTGSTRNSQMKLLAGAVVRKRPADNSASEDSHKSATGDTPPAEGAAKKRKGREEEEEEPAVVRGGEPNSDSVGAMRCIGILPGMGVYPDSSDSEQSSDTDAELADGSSASYDLLGRKLATVAARKLAAAAAKASSAR